MAQQHPLESGLRPLYNESTHMQSLDWIVMLAYAALVIGIGLAASRGQNSAESHLRADRSLPAWAVVFSILATEVSAATYIGVPEAAYKGNWSYLQFAMGALLGKFVLATTFVPRYWQLQLPTVYGFLGQRIGPLAQRACACAFLGGRLIASGVRLFIAALAFDAATGFGLGNAIVVMALLSTVYTLLGGLKAVVWTDVAQGTIFALGALVALLVGLSALAISPGECIDRALEAGKLSVIKWDANPFTDSYQALTAVLGGFVLALASHGTDQENVQHMLNVRNQRGSSLSILTSGLFTFPIVALFLSVGTMLWAFYTEHTPVGYGISTAEEVKRIFPNFIVHELPAGVRGLVFAGLFAAAVSSLGATLNATTSAWTSDIRPRKHTSLTQVRILNCAFGAALTLVGAFFAWYSQGSSTDLVQLALSAMTILYPGILGAFLVALFLDTRGNDRSVPLGMLVGVLFGTLFFFQKQLLVPLGLPELAWPWTMSLSTLCAVLVAASGVRRAGAGVHGAGRA